MKLLCEVCNEAFPNYETWTDHLLSKPHQQRTSNDIMTWTEEQNSRSFLLSCANKPPPEVFDILTECGIISDFFTIQFKSSPKFVKSNPLLSYIIQYDSVQSAKQALMYLKVKESFGESAELLNKMFLTVDKWKMVNGQQRDQDPFYRHHETVANLVKALPLPEQFNIFFKHNTMSPEHHHHREEIVGEIHYFISKHFEKAKIHVFGSCLTDIGDPFSDIDICLDVYGMYSLNFTDDVDLIPKSMPAIEKRQIMSKVRNILKKDAKDERGRPLFSHGLIIGARVPIIKITHLYTGIDCDISFENLMSVMNSRMIKFYTNYDVRVKPLIQFIRYWGRYHNLIGSSSIKSYALTLMVLVFLMKKRIIPNVSLLQQLSRETSPPMEVLDGWEISFCDDVQRVRNKMYLLLGQEAVIPIKYPKEIDLLLLCRDFFATYYNDFDGKKCIVCPLLGEFLPKSWFDEDNEKSIPESFARYKTWVVKRKKEIELEKERKEKKKVEEEEKKAKAEKEEPGKDGKGGGGGKKRNRMRKLEEEEEKPPRKFAIDSPLCVQDPFNLAFNVTGAVHFNLFRDFQILCGNMINHITQLLDQKISLMEIFVPLPLPPKPKDRPSKPKTAESPQGKGTPGNEKSQNAVKVDSTAKMSLKSVNLDTGDRDSLPDDEGVKSNAEKIKPTPQKDAQNEIREPIINGPTPEPGGSKAHKRDRSSSDESQKSKSSQYQPRKRESLDKGDEEVLGEKGTRILLFPDKNNPLPKPSNSNNSTSTKSIVSNIHLEQCASALASKGKGKGSVVYTNSNYVRKKCPNPGLNFK